MVQRNPVLHRLGVFHVFGPRAPVRLEKTFAQLLISHNLDQNRIDRQQLNR